MDNIEEIESIESFQNADNIDTIHNIDNIHHIDNSNNMDDIRNIYNNDNNIDIPIAKFAITLLRILVLLFFNKRVMAPTRGENIIMIDCQYTILLTSQYLQH